MTETWAFVGEPMSVTAEEAVVALRRRIAEGRLEARLTSSAGRLLTVVGNTERALVMFLDEEDAPGAHAVSAGRSGASGGFRLANGQCDICPDEDTVPLGEAFRIVRHMIGTGLPPADTGWCAKG
ncbi:hypothetical protein [Streptomyces roseochromogenus]|uniref:Immunity protein Imm1 n=1 Tax=Streptomyces roseochromogenus subsp. oscitans DS 12.976 TaxID=1352936 RepID=V6JRV4_STRRC|nr:hypothetical protein [Streptomyces roseochromogenus]EST22650.1 hypothetical protein M878_34530 [Streptomyces roseochromogenus subsp. oscitans DS 12.976]